MSGAAPSAGAGAGDVDGLGLMRPDADPGTVLTIVTGRYVARIGTRGAALLSLTRDGADLVVPTTPDLSVKSFSGRVLAPWPNRLRDGAYTWEGREYRVPINEAGTSTALHGLVAFTDFEVGPIATSGVVLRTVLAHPGYPTRLDFTVSYLLNDETGLAVEVAATNTGTRGAPYGASHHPFLTCGGAPIEECALTLPAERVVTADERMLPTGTAAAEGELDLRGGERLGERRIDHAFTGLPALWEARLEGGGIAVVLTGAERWAQVYTGEEIGRAGVAVEPMTCPPDAFTTGEGVAVLQPGETRSLSSSIRGEEA